MIFHIIIFTLSLYLDHFHFIIFQYPNFKSCELFHRMDGSYHFNLCSLVLRLCFSEPNRNEYSYRLNLSEFHDDFFLGSSNKIVSHGMQILIYNGILIKLHRVIKFKKNQHFLLISLSLVSLLKIMKCTYRFTAHISLGCMTI